MVLSGSKLVSAVLFCRMPSFVIRPSPNACSKSSPSKLCSKPKSCFNSDDQLTADVHVKGLHLGCKMFLAVSFIFYLVTQYFFDQIFNRDDADNRIITLDR